MKRMMIVVAVVLMSSILFAGGGPAVKQTVRVQVVFTVDTEVGQFTDAVYYTLDDYNKLDPKDLAAAQKARIDSFVERVKNPPAPVEPTKEQLEAELAAIVRQQASLVTYKTDLEAKISAKTAETP